MYFLTVNQRDYILQELALIHGCIPNGLLFEVTDPKERETVYMVYPREEDGAFAVGKKLLEQHNLLQQNPLPFEVKPLEINLHETEVIDGQKHYQAHIVKPSIIEDLLLAKTKRLLFLISVGQEYHENNCLEATVNLFENIIKGCLTLMKQEKSGHGAINQNPHPRLKNINGEWQIRVLVADSLQAYNETSVEEGRKKYLPMGKKWKDAAEKVFQRLTEACGKDIKLSPVFVHWDEFLAESKKNAYSDKYQFLLDQYLTGAATRAATGAAEFYSVAVDKGYDHRKRQLKKRLEANLKKLNEIEKRLDILQNCEKEPIEIRSIKKEKDKDRSKRKTNQVIGISGDKATDPLHLKEQQRLIKCIAFDLNPALSDNHLQIFDDKFNPPKFDFENYTDRKELSSKIISVFSGAPVSDLRHVVLVGDGGMGKTSLAANYYYSSVQYSRRIWIAGNNLQYNFKSFGKALGILNEKNQQDWKKVIIDWLTQNHNWLLIIDSNSEVDEFIQRILSLPASYGHVILTTRHWKNLPEQNVKVLSVDPMSPEEAKELLRRTSQRPYEDFTALASQLRHLPIALKTAGTHLAANLGMTVSQYCVHKEFDNALQDKSFNKEIAATFNISILAIDFQLKKNKKEAPIPFARYLLTVCSYLAADDIPTELLRRWFAKKYPEQSEIFDEVYQQLLNHRLLHECSPGLVRIHPVLQDFMRVQAAKNKIKEQAILLDEVADSFLAFTNKPIKYIYYHEHVLFVPHIEALLKHSEILKKDKIIRFLFQLGKIYKKAFGNPSESNKHLLKGLELLGDESDRAAEIMLLVAKNYRDLAGTENLTQAIKYAIKSMGILENQNPKNEHSLAHVYQVIRNLHSNSWDKAISDIRSECDKKQTGIYIRNPEVMAKYKLNLLLTFDDFLNMHNRFDMSLIKEQIKKYAIYVAYFVEISSPFLESKNLMELAEELIKLTADFPFEYHRKLFLLIEKNIPVFIKLFQEKFKYCLKFYNLLTNLAILCSHTPTGAEPNKIFLMKAVIMGQKAESLWQEVKIDHPGLAEIFENIAGAVEAFGGSENMRVAQSYYFKSWQMRKRNLSETHPSVLLSYLKYIEISAKFDANFQRQHVLLAIETIEKTVPIIIQTEVKDLLPNCYELLFSLYAKLGNQAHRVQIENYLHLYEKSLRDVNTPPEFILKMRLRSSFIMLGLQWQQLKESPELKFLISHCAHITNILYLLLKIGIEEDPDLLTLVKQSDSFLRDLSQLTDFNELAKINTNIPIYNQNSNGNRFAFFNTVVSLKKSASTTIHGYSTGIMRSPCKLSFILSVWIIGIILKINRAVTPESSQHKNDIVEICTKMSIQFLEFYLGASIKNFGLIFTAIGLILTAKNYFGFTIVNNSRPQNILQ